MTKALPKDEFQYSRAALEVQELQIMGKNVEVNVQ